MPKESKSRSRAAFPIPRKHSVFAVGGTVLAAGSESQLAILREDPRVDQSARVATKTGMIRLVLSW